MKDITIFIKENQDWWSGKDAQLINKNDLMKFAKEALKQSKLDSEEMLNQISQYEDPDERDNAWENGKLDYCKFEDTLANIIADDDKYGGQEGDICDHLWVHVWDLLDELQK